MEVFKKQEVYWLDSTSVAIASGSALALTSACPRWSCRSASGQNELLDDC